MMEMYRDDEKADFKFLHVFTRIQGCEKWASYRRDIRRAKEYVPDAVVAGASEGRPDGHKKSKAARDGAPAAAKLAAAIESCIADVATNAAQRGKQTDARWAELMANQGVKLDLLKATTAAKKRNNDLAFLLGGDPQAMDPQVRAWFMAQRDAILTQMTPTTPVAAPHAEPDSAAGSAAPPSSTAAVPPSTTPTPTPPPATAPSATPSSAPTPTTTPIDLDDAEPSPATI